MSWGSRGLFARGKTQWMIAPSSDLLVHLVGKE